MVGSRLEIRVEIFKVTLLESFDQFMEAYDTFGRAAETKALKVVISR